MWKSDFSWFLEATICTILRMKLEFTHILCHCAVMNSCMQAESLILLHGLQPGYMVHLILEKHILIQTCIYRYEKSNRFGSMGYEDDFLRHLQNIMADVDRRIRRGHSRLNLGDRKVCYILGVRVGSKCLVC